LHGEKVGPFMNGLHLFFGIGTFITPIIIAQVVARQNGLFWTYLLLAVIILPTAAVAFLPHPASPHLAKGKNGSILDIRLIVLISLVFGCYNGASLAYGGWVYTYVLKMNLGSETTAAYMTSVFWGALTLGRLAGIPLAIRYSPRAILRADYLGALVSLLAMLVWPRSLAAVMVTSAGLGFALASIYPTTMSLSGQLMTISGKVTGLFSIGQSAGAMLIPWLIGQFFDTTGPQALAVVLLADMALALGCWLFWHDTRRSNRICKKGKPEWIKSTTLVWSEQACGVKLTSRCSRPKTGPGLIGSAILTLRLPLQPGICLA
jgi:fucose permease